MHWLVVIAHPLTDSLCAAWAQRAVAALERAGHSVEIADLAREGFDPVLSEVERRSYYDGPFDARALAITTLGSPWWVDWLVMRRPVRAMLGTALLGTRAPQCRFAMRSFYRCEQVGAARVQSMCNRIEAALARWR